MPSRAVALAAIVSCSVVSSLSARDALPRRERATPIAFVHARLIPVAGPEIGDGVLIVRGTRIEAVGAADGVRVPSDAAVFDLGGRTVMPGLVDTHSHVGGGWGADGSGPIQPDVRVWDSIDCRS